MVIDGMSKRPEETHKLTIEYDRWLNGRTITSVALVPETPVEGDFATTVATTEGDTHVVIWATGGADGADYTSFLDLVISDGQTRRDIMQLQVRSMA